MFPYYVYCSLLAVFEGDGESFRNALDGFSVLHKIVLILKLFDEQFFEPLVDVTRTAKLA